MVMARTEVFLLLMLFVVVCFCFFFFFAICHRKPARLLLSACKLIEFSNAPKITGVLYNRNLANLIPVALL